MHIREALAIDDVETARGIVRAHPFATVVTADLRATHMPCLVDEDAAGLDRPGTDAREMADQVIAFRLPAASWHAEAKLSQDKPADERARVLAGLERPGPYANAPLAAAMRSLGR